MLPLSLSRKSMKMWPRPRVILVVSSFCDKRFRAFTQRRIDCSPFLHKEWSIDISLFNIESSYSTSSMDRVLLTS